MIVIEKQPKDGSALDPGSFIKQDSPSKLKLTLKATPKVVVSGPVVRPMDETPTRCFTNGYLRIQHDRGRCNGIGMISSRSVNKSSLF